MIIEIRCLGGFLALVDALGERGVDIVGYIAVAVVVVTGLGSRGSRGGGMVRS